MKTQTIPWQPFSEKHKLYIKNALKNKMSVAEGAIRSGKTIDNCIVAATYLETCKDRIHLASGSTIGNAKLNIGVCNGFGLENLFRGRCRWGKFKDNEALFIKTQTGEKIVIFAGGSKADSYKKILGNSYGLWIATEINEHYDCDDSRTSFVKVAFGRQVAAVSPLVLWDLNPSNPNHPIYKDYIDKYLDGYIGGYQYRHFTIHDNLSVSEQRLREIISQYDPDSIWYKRDILGDRCVANGLIYQAFINNEQKFYVDKKDLPPLSSISVGYDVGGSGSNHAFVASGINRALTDVYALKARSMPAKGTTVDDFVNAFIEFCADVEQEYGTKKSDGAIIPAHVDYVFGDSAEQTILNTISSKTKYRALNSIKNEIIDRIRCECLLLGSGRMHLVNGQTEDLANGLRNAVWHWDKKEQKETRLDDGTSDIDIMDAFEYSWEYRIKQLIRG